jgi:hypothetical protein
MLTPKELYNQYTLQICDNIYGRGTPYSLIRLVQFLKHLKTPCYSSVTTINNTGAGKLGIPFKFLRRLDAEAFEEIQPSLDSGTSHAVRNSCDLMRACDIEITKSYHLWESRMSTEYLQHFASTSLYDCLMLLGPDLVSEDTAINRATGCGDLSCVENTKYGTKIVGAVGATHMCQSDILSPNTKYCGSCNTCQVLPEDPSYATDPCCGGNCAERINKCCGGPITSRFDFTYLQRSDDSVFGTNVFTGWIDQVLKHVGIIKRKDYGGYGNFIDNSGSNFYACPDNIFLRYMQSQNGYNYEDNTETAGTIDRVKTISGLFGSPTTISNSIKDLLFNGYGVVLFTNVGFSNIRDSTGLSYPDRNWYHTYSIIGYDDRKTEYPECVFLLANSWGEWNSGGSPSWGPIPPGSFLVTESHLKCMLAFNRAPDYKSCRSRYCPPPCTSPSEYAACTEEGSCVPFDCSDKQRAFGMAFALSTKNGFVPRTLNYEQFYSTINSNLDNDDTLYFNP